MFLVDLSNRILTIIDFYRSGKNWVIFNIVLYFEHKIPGIVRTNAVATARTASDPGGFFGLEIANIFVPSSIKVSCLIPGCSSLKTTCCVNLNQIRIFPDSADIMYLKINY